MAKSKKIAVVAFLLLLAVGVYFVTGTYAKYTSSATATATARVAKWSFKLGGTDIATTETFTFNLFNTVNETDTTTAESHVVSSNEDKVIAPGTGGSFDIVLLNSSEVTAKYGIDYTVTNTANIPVEFCVDGSTWTTSLTDVVANDSTTALAPNGGTTTITVKWRWAFEGSGSTNFTSTQTDITDTTLGTAGTATLTVSAAITATQVD